VSNASDVGFKADADEHAFKISDMTTNPTKDYQKPLGMVYSPGRERLEKPNRHRSNEYCFKCQFNTGNAFLDKCDNCNTDSFIGCGYKNEWRDDGESSFLCCYCRSLQRDIAFTYEIDSDKIQLTSDIVAEWTLKQEATVSFARRQYEAKMVNNGFTVNEFSERLYGYYIDDSAQLGKSIKNLYYHMIDTKEHVCPECGRIYTDVFFPTKVYNPICIKCAAELNYNIRGHRLHHDARITFHYHLYNDGFYPDSENYVVGAFCKELDSCGYPTVTKDDLWNFYFRDRWPNQIGKRCCFVLRDSVEFITSPDIEAYYIYDNEYMNTTRLNEHVEVYIHWMIPLGRQMAMLFYKCSGDSIYRLKMVTIEQYASMVWCR